MLGKAKLTLVSKSNRNIRFEVWNLSMIKTLCD